MKRFISIIICAVVLFTCCVPAFAADKDDFVPVIRFIASSDTHVKTDDDTNTKRIPKLLNLGYDVAQKDPNYKKLDAVLIVGDLTDRGTKPAFDIFWNTLSASLRDETRFLGVVAKNHDGYEMNREELRSYYENLTGNDADFNVVINGYHFIGLSASPKDGIQYSAQQLTWLKKQLDEATKEDPNKPVFFMNHEPSLGTVYGSKLFDGWGIPTFNAILSQYPQVVHFAGHSHYPVNDPRSIWQGAYTEIGTGAIYYAEFTIDAARAYDPPDCREAANCWIVELDKDSNMRLRSYDVNEATQLSEVYLENPAIRTNREYTEAKQKAKSSAPVFDENATVKVTSESGTATVTVPAAKSTDGEPVVLYRVTAKNKLGLPVSKNWTLPYYYRAIEQNEIELTLTGLPQGEYTISVAAENAYGKQSAPVETKAQINGETGFNALSMRIQYMFDCIKLLVNQLLGRT